MATRKMLQNNTANNAFGIILSLILTVFEALTTWDEINDMKLVPPVLQFVPPVPSTFEKWRGFIPPTSNGGAAYVVNHRSGAERGPYSRPKFAMQLLKMMMPTDSDHSDCRSIEIALDFKRRRHSNTASVCVMTEVLSIWRGSVVRTSVFDSLIGELSLIYAWSMVDMWPLRR